MSISTQGGEQRRPGVVATGKKPPADKEPPAETPEAPAEAEADTAEAESTAKPEAKAKAAPAKTKTGGAKTTPAKAAKSSPAKSGAAKATGAKAGGNRPASKAGGPRKPITPVKVSQGRSWGPIALFTAVGVLAVAIVGYGAWAVYQGGKSWKDKAASISGISDYYKTKPDMVKSGEHKTGAITYPVSPPAGGPHNPTWERCMGDVYDAQIPNENAVHALEHGAVWITYNPSLSADQVSTLSSKVKGKDFMLMSPYPGLDKPISLQAWGFQLKVDSASDSRIDEFIKDLRQNASQEPGAVCSAGNYTTGTGTTPRDLSDQTSSTGS